MNDKQTKFYIVKNTYVFATLEIIFMRQTFDKFADVMKVVWAVITHNGVL